MPDLLLFRLALLDLVRPKRLAASAPLVLLPAVLAVLWKAAAAARERPFEAEIAYNTLAGGMIFGFILVILAVLFGTGVVAQEVEQRTIVFLLTRPLPRARILLARFLGAFVGITLTVWLSTLLLGAAVFGVSGLSNSIVLRDLGYLPVGALAYGGLSTLLGAALNRPMIFGLFFAFGWESWIPILPGAFQKMSIMTYLRALVPHEAEDESATGGIMERLLARLGPDPIPPETAGWVLAATIVITLGLAMFIFSSREYAPREDAE